ncbi:MAG: hypothetical protein MPJ24_05220, partial [Pirellulaceae bacterium]|nr:hypothetical protein [Pirellulaceae bacterium]
MGSTRLSVIAMALCLCGGGNSDAQNYNTSSPRLLPMSVLRDSYQQQTRRQPPQNHLYENHPASYGQGSYGQGQNFQGQVPQRGQQQMGAHHLLNGRQPMGQHVGQNHQGNFSTNRSNSRQGGPFHQTSYPNLQGQGQQYQDPVLGAPRNEGPVSQSFQNQAIGGHDVQERSVMLDGPQDQGFWESDIQGGSEFDFGHYHGQGVYGTHGGHEWSTGCTNCGGASCQGSCLGGDLCNDSYVSGGCWYGYT